ncbi:hypothetical protein GCM10009529_17010 [Micropruina glycogenica]
MALALAAFAVSACAPATVGSAQPTAAKPATAPQSQVLPQAASCAGVWVVVDFGSLGGISTKCATSYGTGLAALKSAGFSPTVDDGFVYKIAGKPSKPDINKAYWSYWHATKNDDGSYSSWSYSNVGAASYKPTKGNAEGWRYVLLSDPKTPPQAKPPTDVATPTPTPTPKPTKTSTKPSSKPSSGKTTTKTSATAKARSTQTASATATTKATAKATTARATSTATPISQTATDPATDGSSTETDAAQSDAAQEQPSAAAEPGGGSPMGAIVVGAVVVTAAAGLGGWWMLKGRRP